MLVIPVPLTKYSELLSVTMLWKEFYKQRGVCRSSLLFIIIIYWGNMINDDYYNLVYLIWQIKYFCN